MARFTRHSFSSEIYLLKSKGEILSQIPLFDSFWRDSLDRFFLEIPLQLRHQVLSFSINRISVVWSTQLHRFRPIFLWNETNSDGSFLVGKIIGNRVTSTSIIRFTDAKGKVCVFRCESFDANFLRNHSLSPWGKGAYGINFLRVYASPGDQ